MFENKNNWILTKNMRRKKTKKTRITPKCLDCLELITSYPGHWLFLSEQFLICYLQRFLYIIIVKLFYKLLTLVSWNMQRIDTFFSDIFPLSIVKVIFPCLGLETHITFQTYWEQKIFLFHSFFIFNTNKYVKKYI